MQVNIGIHPLKYKIVVILLSISKAHILPPGLVNNDKIRPIFARSDVAAYNGLDSL